MKRLFRIDYQIIVSTNKREFTSELYWTESLKIDVLEEKYDTKRVEKSNIMRNLVQSRPKFVG